ncbi:MAG: HutD family protein [Anaerovoracaceae bacterium]|nr:HutD family protein [Anaerovoracaceae bacterium]
MQYRIIKPEEYETGVWSGGTTTQLAIYPPGASYADRNFIFRLSSATVDTEQSEFTYLPDYDRWLMIFEGSARLVHSSEREVTINPYEYDAFDGGISTVSFGRVTDYNLMLRKGGTGSMKAIGLDENIKEIRIMPQGEYQSGFAGIFLRGEYAQITLCGEPLKLENGCQLLVLFSGTETVSLDISGSGTVVITQGLFNI